MLLALYEHWYKYRELGKYACVIIISQFSPKQNSTLGKIEIKDGKSCEILSQSLWYIHVYVQTEAKISNERNSSIYHNCKVYAAFIVFNLINFNHCRYTEQTKCPIYVQIYQKNDNILFIGGICSFNNQ